MTCGATVVMDGEGAFRCFFKPLFKCSSCLIYVLLITFQPITFECMDYATLFCYVVFIFWCHQFIFYGLPTVKVSLNPISFTNVLQTLTQSFIVRYSYVTFADGFAVTVVCFWSTLEYVLCWVHRSGGAKGTKKHAKQYQRFQRLWCHVGKHPEVGVWGSTQWKVPMWQYRAPQWQSPVYGKKGGEWSKDVTSRQYTGLHRGKKETGGSRCWKSCTRRMRLDQECQKTKTRVLMW